MKGGTEFSTHSPFTDLPIHQIMIPEEKNDE
jgi:hypothetical protein